MGRRPSANRYAAFETPGPILDLSGYHPRHAGALVVATLAYPEGDCAKLRFKTAMRLLGRDMVQTNSGAWFPVAGLSGAALPVDVRALNGGASRLAGRLQKRLEAGVIALQPILAAEQKAPPLHQWGDRWNRSHAVRKAVEGGGVHDAKNFNHRSWEPSFAVIHLAAAWVAMLLDEHGNGELKSDASRILSEPAYMIQLVREAERLEPIVERSELEIPQEVLLRFRL